MTTLRCRFIHSIPVALALMAFAEIAVGGVGTWTTGGPEGGAVNALLIDPGHANVLYAAAGDDGQEGGGVFKSIEFGTSWTPVNSGFTSSRVMALAMTKSGGVNALLAGTLHGGVFMSTDGGGNWTNVVASYDTLGRYPALGAMYGATVSVRY